MNKKLSLAPLAVVLCLNLSSPAAQAGNQVRNGLPPTNMDSFVAEAKEYAEFIYGDESVDGMPPYFGFQQANRINAGIMDTRDQGLTTGHGSYMPDAWGRDEFLGQEWDLSGARGRSSMLGYQDGVPQVMPPPIVQWPLPPVRIAPPAPPKKIVIVQPRITPPKKQPPKTQPPKAKPPKKSNPGDDRGWNKE